MRELFSGTPHIAVQAIWSEQGGRLTFGPIALRDCCPRMGSLPQSLRESHPCGGGSPRPSAFSARCRLLIDKRGAPASSAPLRRVGWTARGICEALIRNACLRPTASPRRSYRTAVHGSAPIAFRSAFRRQTDWMRHGLGRGYRSPTRAPNPRQPTTLSRPLNLRAGESVIGQILAVWPR